MQFLKVFVYSLFLLSGNFKGLIELPIDITLVTASITFLFVFFLFITHGFKINKNLIYPVIFYILMLPCLTFTEWNNVSTEKALYFFTLTFLALIAPFFIFKNARDIRNYIISFILLCIVISASSFYILIFAKFEGRLTTFSNNPIAIGRLAGMFFLCVLLFTIKRKIKIKYAIPLMFALVLVLINSGSKGPILFTGLVSALVLLTNRYKIRYLLLCLMLVVSIVWMFDNSSTDFIKRTNPNISRVMGFVQGNSSDTSTQHRISMYKSSLNSIKNHPFGIGFGNSENVINSNNIISKHYTYPHNLFLEVFLESGWLSGIFLIFFIYSSVKTAYKESKESISYEIIFILLIFNILNSMVSGNLNDNKMLFALMSISMLRKTHISHLRIKI